MSETQYINPWVSTWEKVTEITNTLANVIYGKRMPFETLADVVSNGGRIILTGDPGTGKTTALVKIATDMLKSNFMSRSRNPKNTVLEIPVVLRAKELTEKTVDELRADYVTGHETHGVISVKTLMIDGLDEIASEKRDLCLSRAQELADDFKCGLVIACRKIPMLMDVLSPFDRYELLPLEYDQAMAFVQTAIKDNRLVAILKDGIANNELKMQLTPLALELLVEVANYEKEVPASLVEIFERYTDLIRGKYEKRRGIESAFEYVVKKRFLAELAWNEGTSKAFLR